MFTFGFIPSRIIFASSVDGKFSPRLRLNHKTLDKRPIMMFGFKCFNTWKLKFSIKKKKKLGQSSNVLSHIRLDLNATFRLKYMKS